jgi:hypothetical protein
MVELVEDASVVLLSQDPGDPGKERIASFQNTTLEFKLLFEF